ncbi:MAG TPA: aspartate-semialdehyde dehydrogenase [Candidatus Lambdaproteobacteria bacterium]|jgi:aspartate-semialdehyde dehydrogenase|nr:aspartate-semialdehyde dehydrogenase [Candidatus Lambdaproteobacteria bacterium]
MTPRVVIAGATGAVGAEFLKLLEIRNFPMQSLRLLASARSAGKTLQFRGESLPVEELTPDSFKDIDLAFFSAGGDRSKEFAPHAVNAGAVVIDNSSAFRMDPEVPLVVPEVNAEAAKQHKGIIANPNCSTIQMVVALNPLHQAAGLKRVVVSTYQAVSGAGTKGMAELQAQVRAWAKGELMEVSAFPAQIAFNLVPHIDVFQENGYTKEEMKMVLETQKIMSLPDLPVSATCVRVPVLRAHSEAVWIETEQPLAPEKARQVLEQAPGIRVLDEQVPGGYPMPWDIAETLDTYVGRIRKDLSHPNGLTFWVVADQLYKGAALNAIQIGELLLD